MRTSAIKCDNLYSITTVTLGREAHHYARYSRNGFLATTAGLKRHSTRQNMLVARSAIGTFPKAGKAVGPMHGLAGRGHPTAHQDPIGTAPGPLMSLTLRTRTVAVEQNTNRLPDVSNSHRFHSARRRIIVRLPAEPRIYASIQWVKLWVKDRMTYETVHSYPLLISLI